MSPAPATVRPASVDLIRRLVGFDTTSHKSNLELIGFIRDYLEGLGAETRLTRDDDGKKANIYASLGPKDRPGILLSGHTDVVPVEGQEWSRDPFRVEESEGKLFGRGTTDMKSFIACALALAPEFVARGLETPLHFAFSYDEEIGCIGVRRLIADLPNIPVKPKLCIIGEPTEMKVIVGHKGKHSWRCRVHGHECHSALLDQGANAVEAAAELIAFIKSLARKRRDEGPHDPDFTPPYSTLHVGIVQGGTALNIVPKDCWFDFEIRNLPDEPPEPLFRTIRDFALTQLLPELRRAGPHTGFDFDEISSMAGLDMRSDSEAIRFVSALAGANRTARVSFGTEAGLFQQAGIPTLVCGPGSVQQAHKPDEFIALEQVAKCEAFLERLMDQMCGPRR